MGKFLLLMFYSFIVFANVATAETKITSTKNTYIVKEFNFSTELYGQSISELMEEAGSLAFEEVKKTYTSIANVPFSKEFILDFVKHSEKMTNKNYFAVYDFTFSKSEIAQEKMQETQFKYIFGVDKITVTLKVKNPAKLNTFFQDINKFNQNVKYVAFNQNKIILEISDIYRSGIISYFSSKYATFTTEDGNLVIKL